MRTTFRAALAATLLLAVTPGLAVAHEGLLHEGCDPAATFTSGPITVSGAFTRAMPPNAPSAGGYLTINNAGTMPDRLLGATSEAAGAVDLHEMKMEGEMMKMAPVAGGLEIPAGGSVSLVPGNGYHLMLTNIGVPFEEGQCVEVTLKFEAAGELPVVLSIGPVTASAPPEHRMDAKMDPNMKM